MGSGRFKNLTKKQIVEFRVAMTCTYVNAPTKGQYSTTRPRQTYTDEPYQQKAKLEASFSAISPVVDLHG